MNGRFDANFCSSCFAITAPVDGDCGDAVLPYRRNSNVGHSVLACNYGGRTVSLIALAAVLAAEALLAALGAMMNGCECDSLSLFLSLNPAETIEN